MILAARHVSRVVIADRYAMPGRPDGLRILRDAGLEVGQIN